ncbi:NlpC/P60 family protein [Actinokineospora spheciospongiae]|uniref:NlpC/P60 family protein n=1 Tax=Actinokineospora spheciospongiae TaxID=909613 RepID=UPI0009FD00D2|nr:NlpC/P60 family protein [Actinokineospora spheciospongiae]
MRVLMTVLAVLLAGVGVVLFVAQDRGDGRGVAAFPPITAQPGAAQPGAAPPGGGAPRFERLAEPARTVVRDAAGTTLATFTDGARTAVLTGPSRTLAEPRFTTATVTTTAWVRLLPRPWSPNAETEPWFTPWFDQHGGSTEPDVLAVATQYLDGAPNETDADGVRYRGDASFGPVAASGAGRLERSDFYDYLGVRHTFADRTTGTPDPKRLRAVDCSGFVRLVYGYRLGYPLLPGNKPGPGLPRRAYAIADSGPGVLVVPNEHRRAAAYTALQPGDLVFFEVEDDEATLDHAAVYLGVDNTGHHRFISSRERANGPTMGDLGGTSLLDDGGHYSLAWRAARRI